MSCERCDFVFVGEGGGGVSKQLIFNDLSTMYVMYCNVNEYL